MDSNFYFYQEVIVKYKIDKLLKPKNLGNGALDNVTLSDLYKALELCYAESFFFNFFLLVFIAFSVFFCDVICIALKSTKYSCKYSKKSSLRVNE